MVLAISAGGGAAALAALFAYLVSKRRDDVRQKFGRRQTDTVILFRNGVVIDHSPDAPHLFDRSGLHGASWQDIRTHLMPGFPKIPADPPDVETTWASPLLNDAHLHVVPSGRNLRVTLSCPCNGPALLFRAAVQEADHQLLRQICDNAPYPIWQTEDGTLTWTNETFEALKHDTGAVGEGACPFEHVMPIKRSDQTDRVSLTTRDGDVLWYEVISRPVGTSWLHYAISINNLVDAEMAQRKFVQTLTKTFAHLPIGLAVFDRDRRLVLFNPALVDLTHLPVDFLSAKPNLLSFFDHMRESRMMPEPKNYNTWREKIYDVVSAAREDRYAETWNLPSGLTYKITGRPHPDGAVAFLIEDISAEISLTRRFRSELEMTQSVLDRFDDAVAVFSRLGVLTFTNAAYRERWNCDPDSAFAEITIVDATKDWSSGCLPSPIWSEIREFVLTLRERACWDAELVTTEGEHLHCAVEPVSSGATMVRFSHVARAPTALKINEAAARD
ncbi:PAS-domain containing protein [Sagittula stellata]|uniref:PAS domain-containing protein n=1 Tax=Sagittula stellata (strain ATCC 700073 / DSM 11524 / E-37) TaxID=388399 RepID=A3KAZ1_SAGS3|nr:PAS-domain containing protein [Sagittula stellata]EBA05660.1 hypothetical protein SSE37_17750 [Sagittula stellata E-37]